MADQFELFVDLEDLTPQQYLTLAAHACLRLGWKFDMSRRNELNAQTPTNAASFGENVRITFEGRKAHIISKCSNKQLLDWGKNKKNVNALTETMASLRHDLSPEKLDELAVMESQHHDEEAKALKERLESGNLTASDKLAIGEGGMWVTYTLIAINVIVFIVMLINGVDIMNPTGEDIFKWGGNMRYATVSGQWWRLITSTFVHIGVIHLLLNMYALFSLGGILEPIMGRWKYLAAYLATGVIASVTSIWWSGDRVSAGASGAIFGLAGIWLALLTTNFIDKRMRGGLLQSMAIFVGYNLLYGLKGNVDNSAHIGGLVSGMALGYLFFKMHNKEGQLKLYSAASIAIAAIVTVFALNSLKGAGPSFVSQLEAIQKLEQKTHDSLTTKLDSLDDEFVQFAELEGIPAYRKMDSMVNEINTKDLETTRAGYVHLLDIYFDQRVLLLQSLVDQTKHPSPENLAKADSVGNELDATLKLINAYKLK